MTILDWKAIDNADITDMQFTDPPELVPVVPKDGYRARRLLFAIGFCSLLFALELAGGYFSGSLALLSDAFHMLSDVLGYALSYTALCVATRSRSDRFSYGYKRIEVLGALASIMLVWVLTIGLVVEAYGRINSPKEIKALPMLYMSIAGVVVNGILIFVFGHEQDTSQQPLTTTDKNAVDINIRVSFH